MYGIKLAIINYMKLGDDVTNTKIVKFCMVLECRVYSTIYLPHQKWVPILEYSCNFEDLDEENMWG